VNSARNAAFVALRHAKRKKIIQHFDFDAVLSIGMVIQFDPSLSGYWY
jgi:hypothetical protein